MDVRTIRSETWAGMLGRYQKEFGHLAPEDLGAPEREAWLNVCRSILGTGPTRDQLDKVLRGRPPCGADPESRAQRLGWAIVNLLAFEVATQLEELSTRAVSRSMDANRMLLNEFGETGRGIHADIVAIGQVATGGRR